MDIRIAARAKPHRKTAPKSVTLLTLRRPCEGPVAWGYGRVSTLRQAVDGNSTQVQEQQTTNYYTYKLQEKGFTWGGFLFDAETSGTIPFRERPAGSALHRVMRKGDAIIISKLDRAFRSLSDQIATTESWMQQGILVHFMDLSVDTSSETGVLVMQIMSSLAEFERKRFKTRSLEGCVMSILKGRYPRALPWGYKYGNKHGRPVIVWDWTLRNKARMIMKLRKEGKTEREIALMQRPAAGPLDLRRQMLRNNVAIKRELNIIGWCQMRARIIGLNDPDKVEPPAAFELYLTNSRKPHGIIHKMLMGIAKIGKESQEQQPDDGGRR